MVKPPIQLQWNFSVWNLLMLLGHAVVMAVIGAYLLRGIEARIDANQAGIAKNSAEIADVRNTTRAVEVRQQEAETANARVEERLVSVGQTLGRVERLVEALYNERRETRQ